MSSTPSSFKALTAANWLQPDAAGGAFEDINLATGARRPMTGERWAELILAVELSDLVPLEVRDLRAVAQGALVYGWFYYPLYTLGDEQLRRVADAAVLHRYRQVNGSARQGTGGAPSFARRLRWLVAHGYIEAHLEGRWQATRALRNYAAHPDGQMLVMPLDALSTLDLMAEGIDALFSAPAATPLIGSWSRG